MKFVSKVLIFIKGLALVSLFSYAQNIEHPDVLTEHTVVPSNFERHAVHLGRAATVVFIVKDTDGTVGSGSGFFIRPNLVVTNIHVIAGIHGSVYRWEVQAVNQPTPYTIKGVLASDPDYDLVILKVEGPASGVLRLDDSDAVTVGEVVIGVGSHGSTHRNALGQIIEGTIGRSTPNFIRVKATLLPGYSGGPLLNANGDVIGICEAGGETKSSGYAIPSNRLKTLLENMPAQEKSLEAWRAEPAIRAYAIVNQGNAKSASGDIKAAIAAYDTAIHLKPDFAAAYAKRGSAKYRLGDYKGSIKDHDVAIRLGLDHASAYVNRGVAKRNLRNHIGAIREYTTALRLDPENVEAYLNRGNAKSDLGEYKLAIEDYNTAISLKPRGILLPLVHVKRASAKSDLGDNPGAIEDYDAAIRQASNTPSILTVAYFNRGLAQLALGNIRRAIEDYDEVIRLKPSNSLLVNTYAHRASANSKLGDNKSAIKDYDAALQRVSENPELAAYVYSRRAAAKLNINDMTGAIEDCNTAVRLDPDLAEAYEVRGDAQSKLGNYPEAIKDYDTAIYLKPDAAKVYYKRGTAQSEIGKASEAKINFRTALKLTKSEGDEALKTDIEKALRHLE